MNLSSTPRGLFSERSSFRHVSDQTMYQLSQIKPSTEPVRESAQVAVGVFEKVEVLVRLVDLGLQVAQDGVDPRELRQVSGFALADNDEAMSTTRVADGGEACQAVAANVATGHQVGFGPALDGLVVKPLMAVSFM